MAIPPAINYQKNNALRWVFLMAALVLVFFLALSLVPERSLTARQRTLGLIKGCELYESGTLDLGLKPEDVSRYLYTNQNDGFALAQIFAAMSRCPTCIPERIATITGINDITNLITVTDGWGHPLNFVWRSDGIKSNVCEALLAKKLPVLIWSSGPNGTNEHGRGDDLFTTNEIIRLKTENW